MLRSEIEIEPVSVREVVIGRQGRLKRISGQAGPDEDLVRGVVAEIEILDKVPTVSDNRPGTKPGGIAPWAEE